MNNDHLSALKFAYYIYDVATLKMLSASMIEEKSSPIFYIKVAGEVEMTWAHHYVSRLKSDHPWTTYGDFSSMQIPTWIYFFYQSRRLNASCLGILINSIIQESMVIRFHHRSRRNKKTSLLLSLQSEARVTNRWIMPLTRFSIRL